MTAVGAAPGQGPYPLPAWAKARQLTGPFISGSTHAVLVFGQDPSGWVTGWGALKLQLRHWDVVGRAACGCPVFPFWPRIPCRTRPARHTQPDNAAEEGDARGGQSARRAGALKTRSSGAPAGSDTTGAGARAWPVSLSDLIAGGLLVPGLEALSVAYKGSTHTAELRPDGTIVHEGRAFGSASAFSIHVKRLITPDKQGDDGWKSVLYQGKPLDVYRCV